MLSQSRKPKLGVTQPAHGESRLRGLAQDLGGVGEAHRPGGVVVLGDSRSSAAGDLEYLGSVKYTREVVPTDPRYEVIDTADTSPVRRKSDQ